MEEEETGIGFYGGLSTLLRGYQNSTAVFRLKNAMKVLASQIEPKVYDYGFLRR